MDDKEIRRQEYLMGHPYLIEEANFKAELRLVRQRAKEERQRMRTEAIFKKKELARNRGLAVLELYKAHGTLEAVAVLEGVSRERIRQIICAMPEYKELRNISKLRQAPVVIKKVCKGCKIEFETTNHAKAYHSKECRSESAARWHQTPEYKEWKRADNLRRTKAYYHKVLKYDPIYIAKRDERNRLGIVKYAEARRRSVAIRYRKIKADPIAYRAYLDKINERARRKHAEQRKRLLGWG